VATWVIKYIDPFAIVAVVAICWSAGAQDDAAARRVEAARESFDTAWASLDSGLGQPEEVHLWSTRWARAVIAQDESQRSAAMDAHTSRMRLLAARVDELVATGMATTAAKVACRYFVAEAEAYNERGLIPAEEP
jgi:hypothetical protein